MNTKIKISIGILVVGVFLITGWLILNQISCKDICYGNKISFCKPVGFKCICENKKICSKKCGAECEAHKDCPKGFICNFEDCKCISETQLEKNKNTTNWRSYSNSHYSIELKYPPEWQLKEEVGYAHRYEGKDGFFQISAVSGEKLSIDKVCENEVHHKLKPYGSEPKIEKLKVDNQDACLIIPSDDQAKAMKNQSALIVHYPQPIQISGKTYNYFILWADKNHINEIAKTLKFTRDETANWKIYRNEEYGFEIKYPQNWNVVAPYFGGVSLFSIAFYPSDKMYSAYGIFFDLTLTPKEGDFQEIQKEWETKMEKEKERFLQSNFEKKVIDENTVLFKISGTMKGEKNIVAGGCIIHQTDNFYYVFSFHTLGGKETVKILEQILSTFRFLK